MNRDVVIYLLTFPSGMQYVGQTNNVARRWRDHASNTNSKCALVVSNVKHYGWDAVQKDILYAGLTRDEANTKESMCIAVLNTLHPHGLNLRSAADAKGMSLITRQRISAANRGKKRLNVRRGHTLTEEHRAKISASHARRDRSTYKTGPRKMPMSEEARARMRAPYSPERLERFRVAMKNKVITEDQLRKAGAASAARPRTPEENAKRSRTVAALHAERRSVGYIRPDTPSHANSGVRNVYWVARTQSYLVNVRMNGKTHNVGYFKQISDAVIARDAFRAAHGLPQVIDKGANVL